MGTFACMSRLVARLDQGEAEAMLATAVKVGPRPVECLAAIALPSFTVLGRWWD